MNWPVRVRPEAELDALRASRWYEKQRPGLGGRFLVEIGRLAVSLSTNALLYRQSMDGLRCAPTRRFPYAVYFRIQQGCVVIVSVLHMRRNRPEL
ncbi:MAG: type II toxin-antitoxin system RelE/ParE family toxin [Proteobacteria bacterium]|jgi:plasmid stabilization system protein ParE|nr:type II toxin-antitoxin system RelE/ParE family toxin [Pseudomonadota bacterium]MBK7115475.1 type II toxin-antitoxin system RelE/ParE family toxin [Pseudomonadota bacterium]